MVKAKQQSDGLLARVNFPLYALEMLSNRHCIVAGGGGSAKTGVLNGFEIFEIHHNGQRFVAEQIVRHETGENAIMNCAVTGTADGHSAYLATGQENQCQLYNLTPTVVGVEANTKLQSEHSASASSPNVRHRKGSTTPRPSAAAAASDADANNAEPAKTLTFTVKCGDSVQTDFTADDPLQRVVRIAPNGKLMATGGTDGHIRVWSFPRLQLLHDVAAHTREADDIDFSADSRRIVSIAKDGQAIVTNAETGTAVTKLQWPQPDGVKYMFKRCRFSYASEEKTALATPAGAEAGVRPRLFTISNPIGRKDKQKGVLQLWDAERGRLCAMVEASECLSALAVRDDGRFVAVGTMFTGSVSIYVAFSLQKVLHIPEAHSMFVTGLEFLPVHRYGPQISSDAEAAVLSISVDNKVCVHSLKPRHTIPVWLALLVIVVALFITFFLCSLLDL